MVNTETSPISRTSQKLNLFKRQIHDSYPLFFFHIGNKKRGAEVLIYESLQIKNSSFDEGLQVTQKFLNFIRWLFSPDKGSIFMKLIPALLSSALLFSVTAPSFAQSMQPSSGTPTAQAAPAPEQGAPKKEKKMKKEKKSKKKAMKKEGEAK
ncbi:hypothetical protein AXG55_09570 [Silvanigrella aquatica]|uniref:Uncharacterized protein n=2 Tax=Silvanigrella aquatica TaxID=1915309 RepID=A0A1L4D1R6_9BACT|nr:hypothetical protein AXG55_09570 [Silvanigrella aquatica]